MHQQHPLESTATVIPEKVFGRWDYVLFSLLTCLRIAAVVSLLVYWFSLNDWYHVPITFGVLTLVLLGVVLSSEMRWLLLPCMRRPQPMAIHSDWRIGVVTTFVPGAEPLEMLEETVKALVALDHPHDTWVLDEGDDQRVRALCQRLGAFHFSRKPFPQYQADSGRFLARSRHGNYNAWLDAVGFARYELITQFDPDHIPSPSFLMEVVGYFEDPTIGYVQAAQVYYNQAASFIARGAAEETYGYYSSTQMASYAMGYPVVTGCHSTHRVTALKEVGGFAPHDADDLLITYLYRTRGWNGVYVPRILAQGLTPVDWNGYLTQQLKWARSVLHIKLRMFPYLMRELPLRTRIIGFLHGLSYIQSAVLTFVGLCLTAFMLATGIVPQVIGYGLLPNLVFLFGVWQFCQFYQQRFYLGWQNECRFHWRAMVLRYSKWPYLLLACGQVVVGHRTPFPLNPKIKSQSKRERWLWPHLFVAVGLGAALLIGVGSGHVVDPLLYIFSAAIILGSVFLILSEYRDFPNPYDERLVAQCVTHSSTWTARY